MFSALANMCKLKHNN